MIRIPKFCVPGLLSKYDDEISGKESKKSFAIGAGGRYDEDEVIRQERERIRLKLNRKMVETLEMPAPRVASDFMTEEESAVKFKKIKKKKKVGYQFRTYSFNRTVILKSHCTFTK